MIAAFEQQSCKHALKQGVLIVFGGVTEEEEGEGQGGEGQARRQGSICEGIADGGPDAASEGPQAGSGASSFAATAAGWWALPSVANGGESSLRISPANRPTT